MSKHQNLTAPAIRALASEANFVERSTSCFVDMVEELHGFVAPRFGVGKKLTGQGLSEIFVSAGKMLDERALTIEKDWREIAATRIHPKGEAISARSILAVKQAKNMGGSGHEFDLVTFRLEGSRKKLVYGISELPTKFSYHSAERLMEYVSGTETAVNEIANTLTHFMPITYLVGHSDAPEIQGTMAVPLLSGAGMLLGEFINPPKAKRSTYVTYNHVKVASTTANTVVVKKLFMVKTFVDRHRMRPHQAYAMDRLLTFANVYSAALDELRRHMAWPQLKGPIQYRIDDQMGDSLRDLFDDPDFVAGVRRAPFEDVNVLRPANILPLGRFAPEPQKPIGEADLSLKQLG